MVVVCLFIGSLNFDKLRISANVIFTNGFVVGGVIVVVVVVVVGAGVVVVVVAMVVVVVVVDCVVVVGFGVVVGAGVEVELGEASVGVVVDTFCVSAEGAVDTIV